MAKGANTLLWIGAGVIAFLLISSGASAATVASLSYLNDPTATGGQSLNNPGNIVAGAGYRGEIQSQGRFAIFSTWAYGIRAMIVLIAKYITTGSASPNICVNSPQNTIRDIINQYSPKKSCGGDNPDNAVENYISYVSTRTGIGPDDTLTADYDTLLKIVPAMAYFEQGHEVITPFQFQYAYSIV